MTIIVSPEERVIRAAVSKPEGELVRYQCGPAAKYLALYKDGVAKEEEMDSVFTKLASNPKRRSSSFPSHDSVI